MKRTLPYTRHRRRKRAKRTRKVQTEIVSFDHGPWEFPIATVRSHGSRAQAIALLGDLRRWLVARWAWLRPRTVPVLVAVAGMLFVLASADVLAHSRHTIGAYTGKKELRLGQPPSGVTRFAIVR